MNTGLLAYADWLDENGHPDVAERLRNSEPPNEALYANLQTAWWQALPPLPTGPFPEEVVYEAQDRLWVHWYPEDASIGGGWDWRAETG